ncbi:FAD-dependent oxidoreductase [Sphingopyxis sp. BSNA05]|uniref:FAD-dependent oxidoreductase n=1 Tax=Sphingopyxis sp. BSNA05 TaxID=1236614 RepID=UPI001564F97E
MTDLTNLTWDHEVDLLVVGTGAAGLTTAVVGAVEGLKVLVIEKTEFYGGTTALSGGVAWIPNNPLMKAAGIPDTPDDALTYLKHNVGNRVAPAKLEALVEHAPQMAEYMQANSAVQFQMMEDFPDYRPETPGGSNGGRSIDPKVFSGRKLDDYAQLRKQNTEIPGGIVGSVKELRRLAFSGPIRRGCWRSGRCFRGICGTRSRPVSICRVAAPWRPGCAIRCSKGTCPCG